MNGTNDKPIASPELCEWLAKWSGGEKKAWVDWLKDVESWTVSYTTWASLQILAACAKAIGVHGMCDTCQCSDGMVIQVTCGHEFYEEFDAVDGYLPAAIRAAEAVKGFLEGKKDA